MTVMTIDFQKTLTVLSSMYLCKPTKDVVEGWRTALSENAPAFLSGLKTALDGLDVSSEQEQEDLLWEYTQLFVGPYKLPCPPWESVYTSPKRLMMQSAFEEVSDSYRREGLVLGGSDVMADHIGVELNFLALLLRRLDENPAQRSHYVDATKKFVDGHLMQWVPAFTRDLEEAAAYTFYKVLARTTRELVDAVQGEALAGIV